MDEDPPYKISINSLQGLPEPGDDAVEEEDRTELIILSCLTALFFAVTIGILITWYLQYRRKCARQTTASAGTSPSYGTAAQVAYDAGAQQVNIGARPHAASGSGSHPRHRSKTPSQQSTPTAGPSGHSPATSPPGPSRARSKEPSMKKTASLGPKSSKESAKKVAPKSF